MSNETPHLLLPLLMPSQAQKHLTHNEALVALDAILQLCASARLSEPPAAPLEGERFLVAAEASGAFAARAGEIAMWEHGGWRFFHPQAGWILWLRSEGAILVHDGTAWTDLKVRAADRFGIGATPSAEDRLAVAGPAVLFDHAGADSRVKINKAASGDTASLIFQRDYVGRAELGLAGVDGFRLRVSVDGTDWTDALAVDPETAAIGVGLAAPRVRLDVDGPIRCKTYSVAAMPPAAAGSGQIVMVSDAAGGAVLAFSDGTHWRQVTDRVVVQ